MLPAPPTSPAPILPPSPTLVSFGASGVRFGGEGFVEVLAATQTPTDKEWFQGTADAVRQYAWLFRDIKNRNVEDIVILSGDHLYRMDYMKVGGCMAVRYHTHGVAARCGRAVGRLLPACLPVVLVGGPPLPHTLWKCIQSFDCVQRPRRVSRGLVGIAVQAVGDAHAQACCCCSPP